MTLIPLELWNFHTTTTNEGSVSQTPSIKLLTAHIMVFPKLCPFSGFF